MKINEIIADVLCELDRAQATHAPMNSAHEGWATLYEEVCELWEEVRKRPSQRYKPDMDAEAVQVAAMALRFLHDVTRRESE